MQHPNEYTAIYKEIARKIEHEEPLTDEERIYFETLNYQLHQLQIVLREFVEQVIQPIINGFKEMWSRFTLQFYNEPTRKKQHYTSHHYALDFKRPLIQHQVMDRKPKHLIKKIIR